MRVLVFTNMYPFERMPYYGSFVEDEVEALRRAGVETDVFFVNGKETRWNYARSPWGLARRLREGCYDLVHVHHSFCALIATWPKRRPVVWTFHEGEISGDEAAVLRDDRVKLLAHSKRFKRAMARRVDAVIVVSDHLKAPLGRPDAVTIPCGIDLDRFRPTDRAAARRELGLDPDGLYVLFPSDPARAEKRFDVASAAVGRLADRGVAARIVCLENVPHERVPVYMNAADVMLMTSAFEASPVTVREALACGLPVVSTDVGDVRAVTAGIDGCAVVGVDAAPEEIADRLAAALSPPRRADARDRMESYSIASTTRRLIDVYADVLGRAGGEGGSR